MLKPKLSKSKAAYYRVKNYRTKKGLLGIRYLSQKYRSIRDGRPLPAYTLNEFRGKFIEDERFNSLYNNWVKSGYEKRMSPSLDRIDCKKPYTFENIQWMTWEDNCKKGITELSKPVIQLDLNGNYINEHPSIIEAGRKVNKRHAAIGLICTGVGKGSAAHGFKWIFKSDYYG